MKIKINWQLLFGLKSKYIGAVYEIETKKVIAVIDPDYDLQLEDPYLLKLNENKLAVLKIPRKVSSEFKTGMGIGGCLSAHMYAKHVLESKICQ